MKLARARPIYSLEDAEAHNARVLGRDLPLRPKTKKRAKRVRSEEPIHIAIKNYLESVLPPEWIVHHSRNGGMSKGENGRAKAMGAKAGWLDIVIVGDGVVEIPGNDDTNTTAYAPKLWFVEVKDEDGVLSSAQKDFIKKIEALGIDWGIARSIDDARALIRKWKLPNRDLAIKG